MSATSADILADLSPGHHFNRTTRYTVCQRLTWAMPNAWRHKVVEASARNTVQRITDTVKGMSAEPGDPPAEATLHGRLAGGLYAYVYPLPLRQLQIVTDEFYYEEGEIGSLLKHKPKNESLLNPGTAVDVSTRVSEWIICSLDRDQGEILIEWLEDNW